MTTHLQGADDALPAVQPGPRRRRGQPAVAGSGFATAYLWEQVWARDSVLDLIAAASSTSWKRRTTRAARRASAASSSRATTSSTPSAAWWPTPRATGPGQRYLIQHSAGSGQEQLHRLAGAPALRPARRRRPARLRLDHRHHRPPRARPPAPAHRAPVRADARAWWRTSTQTSRQLKRGAGGRQDDHRHHAAEVPGHRRRRSASCPASASPSSSTRRTPRRPARAAKSLKAVLAAGSLEEAEQRGRQATDDDLEDRIVGGDAQRAAGCPTSATSPSPPRPSPRRWSCSAPSGPTARFAPFSLYSMRQAIEEGFILDVLENYTTYQHLLEPAQDDRGRPALRPRARRPTCSSRSSTCTSTPSPRRSRSWSSTSRGQVHAPHRRPGQGDDRHPLAAARRALQAGGGCVPQGRRAIPSEALVAFSGTVQRRRPGLHRSRA